MRRNTRQIVLSFVLISVLAMGAVAVVSYTSSSPSAKFGGLNSVHEHAAFLVIIEGTSLGLGQAKYQVKSPYIHVENGIGTTLHKHASLVPVGEFFRSVGMDVRNSCLVLDDGLQYCSADGKKLRFFVNRVERNPDAIINYVLDDNDRFLLLYGEDSKEAADRALEQLEQLPIFRS